MKIAVIGAGIYGITIALHLNKIGHNIDIYEKEKDILQAASGINQYRLHRGYHYPRSPETINSSLESESIFRKEFKEVINNDYDHYYCIAKEGSRVNAEQYKTICDLHNLSYFEEYPNFINKQSVEICLKVNEALIDPQGLYKLLTKKLKESNIEIKFNTEIIADKIQGNYDFVIICTYANTNYTLDSLCELNNHQFEVCEKIVVKLPDEFATKSVVIMDGPFTCIDPYGRTGYHVMGNVVHALHHTNVGKFPIVPDHLKPYLNNGVHKNPPHTNFNKFLETAKLFMPNTAQAKHIGSMYTVRTVLPNLDATDARPTLINRINSKVISVFSGKLTNAVLTANQIEEEIIKN